MKVKYAVEDPKEVEFYCGNCGIVVTQPETRHDCNGRRIHRKCGRSVRTKPRKMSYTEFQQTLTTTK